MQKETWIKLFRYHRISWICIITLFIVNLIFYAVVTRNQKNEIDTLNDTYANKRKIEAVDKNDKSWQYTLINKDLHSFKEYLPTTSSFAESVRELNTVLYKHGLSVSSMIFKPEKTDHLDLWKYTTSFKMSGTYKRLRNMLSDIQNLPGLFCIEDVSLLNRSKQNEDVEMSLTISTYFR
jgi:Tfp pilus assembly protein PilO